MKTVRFFVGNEQLDIGDPKKLGMALTYSIADLTDPTKRSGSNSKSIRLPATKNNKQVLKFIEDINTADGIDQRQQPTARIEVNGTVVIAGILKVNRPILDGNKNIIEYVVNILGDNGDWKEKIKNLKIEDIDYSDQNHIWNKANIDASETIHSSREYVYPLANYGLFKNSPTTTATIAPVNVSVEDRYPALNVAKLVGRILNESGYKYTSSFLDGIFGSRLYIPFTNENITTGSTTGKSREFRVGRITNQILDYTPGIERINQIVRHNNDVAGDFFNTGGDYNITTFRYTAPVERTDIFISHLVIKGCGGGYCLAESSFNTSDNRSIGTGRYLKLQPLEERVLSMRRSVHLEAGQTIEVRVHISADLNCTSAPEIVANGSLFSIVLEEGAYAGETISISENAPNITQSKYLKGLKEMFNLYFLTNVFNRNVFIEPRDEFYVDTINDISNKLDVRKKIEIKFLGGKLGKKVRFCYAEDSNDGGIKFWENTYQDKLGSHIQIIANKFAKDTITEMPSTFSNTIMGHARDIGISRSRVPNLKNTHIPEDESIETEWTTSFNIRIWYYHGITNLYNGEKWKWEGTERTHYPFFSTIDNRERNDNSLQFKEEQNANGLFNKYWASTFKHIDESRILIGYFHITDKDISDLINPKTIPAGFDYRMKFKIHSTKHPEVNGFYRLNKIHNYDPLNKKPTKCEFILDVGKKVRPDELTDEVKLDLVDSRPNDSKFGGTKVVGGNNGGIAVDGKLIGADKPIIIGKEAIPARGGQIVIGENDPDSSAKIILATPPVKKKGVIRATRNTFTVNKYDEMVSNNGLSGLTLMNAKSIVAGMTPPPTRIDEDVYIIDNSAPVASVIGVSWQSGNTVRYNMASGADLSSVNVGDTLKVASATNETNNGRFRISTVNDGADYVEIFNTEREDATDDEGGGASAVFSAGEWNGASSGDWAKFNGQLNRWDWITPRKGYRCFNEQIGLDYQFDSTDWNELPVRWGERYIYGCDITWLSGTQLQIGSNSPVNKCRDDLNSFNIPSFTPLLVDTTVNGAGGIDPILFPITPNTEYGVFVISDYTKIMPTAVMLSSGAVPISFPAGYNKSRLIGVAISDNTGALVRFIQTMDSYTSHLRYYEWDVLDRSSLAVAMLPPAVTWTPHVLTNAMGTPLAPLKSYTLGHFFSDYTNNGLPTERVWYAVIGTAFAAQSVTSHTEVTASREPDSMPFRMPIIDMSVNIRFDNITSSAQLYVKGFTHNI